MSESEQQRRWDLFRDHMKQDWDDIQSSTDSFDQSLLTLSTGALALSIAFIKDIVQVDAAVWMNLLYTSWCLFIVCILVTVVSFQLSIAAAQEHLRFLPKFYFEEVKEENNPYTARLKLTTRISGAAFILGLFCIMLFGIKNTARAHVSEKGKGNPVSTKVPATDERGRAPVQATPVPETLVQEGRRPISATPLPKNFVGDGRAPINATPVPGLEKGRAPVQVTPVPSPAPPTTTTPATQTPSSGSNTGK
jgi:hypothetical protein